MGGLQTRIAQVMCAVSLLGCAASRMQDVEAGPTPAGSGAPATPASGAPSPSPFSSSEGLMNAPSSGAMTPPGPPAHADAPVSPPFATASAMNTPSSGATNDPGQRPPGGGNMGPGADADIEPLLALLREPLELTYAWSPWWAAPVDESAVEQTLWLNVDVEDVELRVIGRLDLVGTLTLRDGDGRFETIVATICKVYVPFETGQPDLSNVSCEFESPDLAEQLELPPAADPSLTADLFVVRVAPEQGSVSLASERGGTHCGLLETPRQALPPACQRAEWQPPSSQLAEVGFDEELAPGLTPMALLTAITDLGPLRVEWPDEPATDLQLELEPESDACAIRGKVPDWMVDDVVEPMDWPAGAPKLTVLAPVTFHLESDDGRLRVAIPGHLETTLIRDEPWEGQVSGFAGMSPLDALDPADAADFDVPQDHFGLLSVSLAAPLDAQLGSKIHVSTWHRYPGVAPFPEVHESASNRAWCFGQQAATLRAEIVHR